jgi:hypothetical protein
MKQKALIVFQDGRADLERTAVDVRERLGSGDREAILRPASKVTIPELLAASLYVFGTDEVGSGSYTEVARVLGGINLAGRRVAYFGASGAAVAWLKGVTAESELVQVGADLLGAKPEPAAIAAWVRSLA